MGRLFHLALAPKFSPLLEPPKRSIVEKPKQIIEVTQPFPTRDFNVESTGNLITEWTF